MKAALISLLLALPVSAQGLHWEQNQDAAKKRAQAEQKVIFQDLCAEWCGPCLVLKKNVFPDPAAQSALKNVIPFEMAMEEKDRTPLPEGMTLARLLNLRAFPALFMQDVRLRVQTIENFLASGFRKDQNFEVLICVSLKTIRNHLDHISPTELDQPFRSEG